MFFNSRLPEEIGITIHGAAVHPFNNRFGSKSGGFNKVG
jgi:hypothetical protein